MSPILPLAAGDVARSNARSFSGRAGLPRGVPSSANASTGGPASRARMRLPRFVRRILRPPTLDFETAIWEIVYLVIAPRKVYKSLYYHKQTKNTWARDDPSFVILLSAFLVLSAIAWGLAYSPGFGSILKLMVYMVLVDFLAVGLVVATVGWLFANRFLRQQRAGGPAGAATAFGGEGVLEWAYCFDVHCNAFLVIWLYLYIVQFILLPILGRSNWISLLFGNALYMAALCHYFVITFMGYSSMPFLEHTELLLFPVLVIGILFVGLTLCGFNVARAMVHMYFG